MMRIAALAEEHGVAPVPHAWKSGIIKAASLHCNAVPAEALFQEYRVAETEINTKLTRQPLPIESDGYVSVPTEPGLGIDLDEDVSRPYGGTMTQISSDAAARLAARAAAVIPGGVNSGQRRVPGLEELVVTATSGSTFTDADGRVYTDYHAAFGPPLLGHNDPDVDAAAPAQR